MAEDYAGDIVLEVDGQEVDVISYSVTEITGTKAVKTMNRKRRVKGTAKGVLEFTLSITVPVPFSGEINWGAVVNAKLTDYPVDDQSKRTSYLDCSTTQVGREFSVDNEARRTIEMIALDKVEE